MRRRNGNTTVNRRTNAARSFYEQHDDKNYSFGFDKGDVKNDCYNRYSNNNERSEDERRRSNNTSNKKRSLLSIAIIVVRNLISILQSFVTMITNLIKRNKENVDRLDYCVACSKSFSYLRKGRKRNQCSNCLNDFCEACLKHKHLIFDGKPGGGKMKQSVCQYCFFTLCARHCRARCCNELPVKALKAFLARKGVNSKTALEKSDLIHLIHTWSLDLDAKARADAMSSNANNDDDIEAGGNLQYQHRYHAPQKQQEQQQQPSCTTSSRQQTSYSASSAHLILNSMSSADSTEGSTLYHDYSNLGIHELRHILYKRGIQTSGCIEKSEFVTLLVESDNGLVQ